MNKLKLDISQQVEYLEGLGIRFEIFQKSQAIAFLTHTITTFSKLNPMLKTMTNTMVYIKAWILLIW